MDSLRHCHILREKEVLAECLEILAMVSADRGEYERAAQLSGAALALWDELHITRPLSQHSTAAHQEALQTVRRQLPEKLFQARFRTGQAMTLDAMAEFALD